jgi:peptidoglycan/xylan/chitin deacetylase (PgdA/CDA1 family)
VAISLATPRAPNAIREERPSSVSTQAKDLPTYQRIIYKLLFLFGLTEFARFCNRTKTMILCYHGVTKRLGPDPEDRSAISVNRVLFLAQLVYIRRRYRVISLREYLVKRENDQRLPPYSVILTFDDGPRNFLTVVAPILEDLGLPATVFLVTERVDSRGQSNMGRSWAPVDDQVSLSWSEAGTLQFAPGIEFGSHTCSHPELPQLNSSEIELELRDSLRAIRNNLHQSGPVGLAYPYGYYSEAVDRKARSAGYSCALTTDAGSNSIDTDLFRLRRAVVRRYDTTDVFAARVSGLVGWLRIVRDFFLQTFSSFRLLHRSL